jgi:hypothetical protein
MGSAGGPVHILQWRASWQRDLVRRTGAKDVYPRLIRDLTPEELLGEEAGASWAAARAVGNPLASLERTSSVEELVAEGFGTLTPLATQRGSGAGVHEDGRWKVALALPLERGEAGDRLDPGSVWPVAFAVWRGHEENRGSRKHYADWVSLELELPAGLRT